MAIQTRQTLNAEQFDEFVFQPENVDQHFEFIAGEIVKMVSNSYLSIIAARLLIKVGAFVLDNNLGHTLGADGGYQIGNDRYIPDVSYISYERQPEPPREAYIKASPDLVVEVISSTDSDSKMRMKVGNYLAAKVVVWVVQPEDKMIEVYVPNQAVQVLGIGDMLDGGDVLPNFKIKVEDIFPKQYDTLESE